MRQNPEIGGRESSGFAFLKRVMTVVVQCPEALKLSGQVPLPADLKADPELFVFTRI